MIHMWNYYEHKINQLKKILDEENIEYIEDNLRILINLKKIYTVEGIITIHGIKVLDEVINYEELGGDNEHYYLVAKREDIPIINHENIKKRIYTDSFNNRVFLEYGYDIQGKEDGGGYVSHKYVQECLQSSNIEFTDTVDCIDNYTEVKIKNAILV